MSTLKGRVPRGLAVTSIGDHWGGRAWAGCWGGGCTDDLTDIGPKARSLVRLIEAGLPVPEARFLPAAAYRDHALRAGVPALLAASACQGGQLDPGPIRDSIESAPLDPDVAEALRRWYAELGAAAACGALVGQRGGPADRELRRSARHVLRRGHRTWSPASATAGRRCSQSARCATGSRRGSTPRRGHGGRSSRCSSRRWRPVSPSPRPHRRFGRGLHRDLPRASARLSSRARSRPTASSSSATGLRLREAVAGDKRVRIVPDGTGPPSSSRAWRSERGGPLASTRDRPRGGPARPARREAVRCPGGRGVGLGRTARVAAPGSADHDARSIANRGCRTAGRSGAT